VDIVSSRMLGQYGFLAGVFQAFSAHKISVDMVATSEVSISLTLDAAHDLAELKRTWKNCHCDDQGAEGHHHHHRGCAPVLGNS